MSEIWSVKLLINSSNVFVPPTEKIISILVPDAHLVDNTYLGFRLSEKYRYGFKILNFYKGKK